jgi:hypothetical protein
MSLCHYHCDQGSVSIKRRKNGRSHVLANGLAAAPVKDNTALHSSRLQQQSPSVCDSSSAAGAEGAAVPANRGESDRVSDSA